jgi:peptidoglycan hydrolase-like protein with peptidoglycan-binding domain
MRIAYLLVAATALVSAAGFAGAEQQRQAQTAPQQRAETVVEQAQKKLAALDLKPGEVNGIEHKKTQAAVKRFQKSQNLAVTGRLDTQTLAALGVRPAITVARSAPPSEQLSVVPSESSTIASASESSSASPSESSGAAQSESLSPPSGSSRESSSERMAEPSSEQPQS